MKRKSIFLTIVAVFLVSITWGQQGTWPRPTSPDTGIPTDVLGVDTLYFCERADSLYPIDLGYDGLGLALLPSYGDWTLHATSSANVAADYVFGSGKNGGAGNAFKTVGTEHGGYLFQYTAQTEQCQLPVGKKFWVFIFILPTAGDVQSKDTLFCQKPNKTDDTTLYLNNSFKELIQLYNDAGLEAKWKSPSTGEVKFPLKEVKSITFLETLEVTPKTGPSAKYTCGREINFSLTVNIVAEIGPLDPLSKSTCDTTGLGDKSPNILFKRENIIGSYTPATINEGDWEKIGTVNGHDIYGAEFQFTYKNCKGITQTPIKDSLYLGVSAQDLDFDNWGKDTVVKCRQIGEVSIIDLYNDPQINYPLIPIAKPDLTISNSYWYDRGLTGAAGSINGVYGTKTNVPSLPANSYKVNFDELRSNMGYHYLWRVDGGAEECYVGTTSHAADSGWIVVMIGDEVVAQDFTAQLCKDSYTSQPVTANQKLSLFDFTGIKTTWTGGLGLVTTMDSIDVNALADRGTYKYTYHLPAGCGPGGDGVFYLKVSPSIKVSASKTVKYCSEKLPAMINLNDVMNIAVQGVTWSLASANIEGITPSPTNLTGFSPAGIIRIPEYARTYGTGKATLVFEISSPANACNVKAGTKLTLIFDTVIP